MRPGALAVPLFPVAAPRLAPADPPCRSPDEQTLRQLLRDLGVERVASGVISLREDAPLAGIRRAIARGRAASGDAAAPLLPERARASP